MMHSKRFIPPAFVLLVFAVYYLYLCIGGLPLFVDADVPYHIAAGDAILALGKLPSTDLWSFTAGSHHWYIIFWSWDIVVSLLNKAAGLIAVYIFVQLLIAAILALLAYNLMLRNIGTDALLLTLLMAGLGMVEFSTARPYLMGYLYVVIFQQILHRSREDSSLRRLIWLPLIIVLWVNVHGSFLIAFGVLGAYGLEALLLKRWEWFRQLILISALCALAALINPYGFGMYHAVMGTLHSHITRYIREFLPFVFGQSIGISMWLLLFILGGGFRDPRIPLADKILSFSWLLMMLFSVRHSGLFILMSAPFMAQSLQGLVEQLDRFRTRRDDIMLTLRKPGMQMRMALLAAAVVVASPFLIETLRGKDFIINSEEDPAPAIAWLQQHAAGKRILNDLNLGGFIVYQTHGKFPVFVDGRVGTAYPEEVLDDYLAFFNLEDDWENLVIEPYRIDGILMANGQPFPKAYANGQYHDQWKEVYHDKLISIYFKKRAPAG